MKPKIIFLYSHPIQYIAPFLKKLQETNDYDFKVYYCSQYGVKKTKHKPTNINLKWDIPLLDGYRYAFLKNHSLAPSIFHFFGLINLGILKTLFQENKAIVVVHGWNYFTHVLTIVFGRLLGHSIYIRAESPLSHEVKKKPIINFFKKILFKFIDKFLYIGSQNKAFFKRFSIDEEDLIFLPYTVDNDRFHAKAKELKGKKNKLKQKLDIPLNKTVFLFCAVFTEKKRPLDLIKAFNLLDRDDAYLIFVGDGPLREKTEEYITRNKVKNVRLAGFINQSKIVQFYAVADAFVICSGIGETWGLVVNEAMNFSLPIIASSTIGCSDDLVKSKNGFTYKCGDIKSLSYYMKRFLDMPDSEKNKMGQNSLEMVQHFSYEVSIENMKKNFI